MGPVGPGRRRGMSQGFILFLSRCEVGVEEDGERGEGSVLFFPCGLTAGWTGAEWGGAGGGFLRRFAMSCSAEDPPAGRHVFPFFSSFFFLSTLPLPGGGVEAEPQARSFDRLFSFFFASLVEAASIESPPGGGAQRLQGPSFSSFFPFFPLAWQDRTLALKARSSPFGCRPFFFFPSG